MPNKMPERKLKKVKQNLLANILIERAFNKCPCVPFLHPKKESPGHLLQVKKNNLKHKNTCETKWKLPKIMSEFRMK